MSNLQAMAGPLTGGHQDAAEIGSDFELVEDAFLTSQPGSLPWEDGSDITYVESGRQALTIVEAELRRRGHTHLYVPSLFCDSMIEPFVDNSWRVTALPVDNNLAVQPADLTELAKDGVLLHAPYYGRQDSPAMLETLEKLRRRGVPVVVDETHRVFAGPSHVADFRVASLRKLFPLYDGGYVTGVPSPADLSADASSTGVPALRRAAMQAKSAALAAGDGSRAHLQLFSGVEHATEIGTRPRRMSAESAALLRALDMAKIRRRRQLNAVALTDALGRSDHYRVTNPPTQDLLPSHLVLETDDPARLRGFLTDEQIYCPLHWPVSELLRGPLNWPRRYLSLPIDHRYDDRDMARMGDAVKSYFVTDLRERVR